MEAPTNALPRTTDTSMKARKVTLALMVSIILCAALMAVPFADFTTISDGINDGMMEIYALIQSITLPIATVVFAFNAIKMFAGGQRSMEQAKMALIMTVLVIFLIWFAPAIIRTAGGWFKGGQNWGNWGVVAPSMMP